jgi:hypothetical protein
MKASNCTARLHLLSVSVVVLAAMSLSACGGSGGGGTPTPTPTPLPPLTGAFDYEGIDYVSWWFNQYQGQEGTGSRQALAATSANWAGLLVTWYMVDRNSTTIAADAEKSPTIEALTEAIRDLRGRGLKVMLKPHVDSNDNTWRGDFLPPDTNAWFASYTDYIMTMARLAEQEHVEMLCVGTELKMLSGTAFQSKWAAIIAQVRSVYGGKLTYAANASTLPDEYASVSFWSLLDYAGLDAYVALTSKTDPTRAELVAAWSPALTAFRNWASGHGKPVIFTEIGYKSVDGANRAPWNYSLAGAYDPTEQTDCYYAMFSVFLPERSWMKGAFWWSWDVPAPPANDTGYTPRNKPAGDFLRERYTAS